MGYEFATDDDVDEDCIDGYPEHDEDVHYDEADGTAWTCRRCGAEGWEPAEDTESTSPGDTVTDQP